MILVLLTPEAPAGVGTLTASATLAATGRKATSGSGGSLTDSFGFTAGGRKDTSGAGGDIANTATLVGAGEQTAAGQGLISLNDLWTANDVWLVDDVTGLLLVDDVTGEALWLDGHDPQVKRTSGAGTLTQPATFTSSSTRTSSGAGNLHYVFNAMTSVGAKGGFGTGAITEAASFTSAGVRVPTGNGSIVMAATFASTGRKDAGGTGALALTAALAATGVAGVRVPAGTIRRWPGRRAEPAPYRMGHGYMELHARMRAVGHKSFESDDDLVLTLAA